VYDFWQQASTDISGLAHKFAPQLKEAGLALLGTITGLGAGLLLFFAALIVAGILMAYGETGHKSAVEIASRIFGPDNWAATISLAGALTQVFCYRARLVASSILLPVRRLAGATYDEAAQHDNETGVD
jgi:hypothetical protein